MRALANPAVLGRAFVAGTFSAVLCYPRLAHWTQREDSVWLLVVMVDWVAFMMWAAVFAWHERHAHRELLPRRIPPPLWLAAVSLGVAGAALSFHLGDPALRRLAPTDFPQNPAEWAEHLLFNLALEQLFLCFAPFAVFVRLLPGVRAAGVATVLFGLLVFALKLRDLAPDLPLAAKLVLVAFRALHGAVTVWLFTQGGLWLVWLFALLLQSRHWFAFP